MIAQISHTGNTAGIIMYHDKKMQNGVATILDSQNMNTSSRNNIQASLNSYNVFSNEKSPTVHISINFHTDDRPKLSDGTYREISKQYLEEMGYGNQPYIVYKHKDQAHPHIHIVTSKIKDNGNKISNWGERYRSQNISRNLELNYNLTQVPSLKNSNKEAKSLENEKGYLTYIRSSVKEALSLRPKRKNDLEALLRSRYGIEIYQGKNKGAGFALLGKNHLRYKNGYGTKGIAGSKIDKNWSDKNIKKTLSSNFENAPKRYRNLKATEGLILKDISFFNAISTVDFDLLFGESGTFVHQDKNVFLVVDTKGKNVYSERDLKGIDFSVISKTTEIKNPNSSGLFKRIAEETLWAYKNDYTKKLLLSSFINDVAEKGTFMESFDLSKTFQRFKPLLSEAQAELLRPYLNDYFEKLPEHIHDIQVKEKITEKSFSAIVSDFAFAANLNQDELLDKFRLNIYNDSYSPSSTERGMFTLMEKTIEPNERTTSKDKINPNLIFDVERYLDRDKIPSEIRKTMDGLLIGGYINAAVMDSRRNMTSPESLVRSLNEKGIELTRAPNGGGTVQARIKGYDHISTIKGVDDFILSVELERRNTPLNFDDIRFMKAMENGNTSYAFSLMAKNKLSEGLYTVHKDLKIFGPLWNDKHLRDNLKNQLWSFKTANDIPYISDLKTLLKENPNEFISHALSSGQFPIEWIKEFLEDYTSNESINESTRLEKEHFSNTHQLGDLLGDDTLTALMGLRNGIDGTIVDLQGKFGTNGHLSHSSRVNALQEQPYFSYYSNVFNEVSFHIHGDKRDAFRLDYSNLLVYESFKDLIPEKYRNDYQNVFEKSYIDYFTSKLENHLSEWTNIEKVNYLNSKGIRAIEKSGGLFFKLGGSDKVFETKNPLGISGLSTDNQIGYLREHGFSTFGTRRTEQLRFVISMEKGNYTDAAWLLKQNKASLSLSGVEKNRFEELKEQLDKLQHDKGDLSKSIVRTMKQDEGGDGHYKGKKSKNKTRKNGPRL